MTKLEISNLVEKIVYRKNLGLVNYTEDTMYAINLINEYSFNYGQAKGSKYTFSLEKIEENKWAVFLQTHLAETTYRVENESLPLAICMVILKSRGLRIHETK